MKKIVLIVGVVLILAAAALLYWAKGQSVRLVIAEAEIQSNLDQRFPIKKKHLALFEMEYSHPKVKIDPRSDRVSVSLEAKTIFTINDLQYNGAAEVSGSLRYDPASAGFFLDSAKVERLQLEKVPEKYTENIEEFGSLFLTGYLQERPVYTIKGEDLKTRAAKLVLKEVKAETGALIVVLGL